MKGLEDRAITLMIQSISEATLKQYSKPLIDWASYCRDLGVNMYNPEINMVITWLSDKYSKGASYGTINTYRAALSLILGDRIGKDSTISRLLKGVYKNKPTKPKYDRIYDLDSVLEKLENLFPLEGLSLSELTDKLVVLLALITAHRKQTISLIKINNIIKTDTGYEIEIPDRIKSTRVGAFQPLLILPMFSEKPELCI